MAALVPTHSVVLLDPPSLPAHAGLTEAEARERHARGLANTAGPRTGRSYREIVRDNLFTFINVTLLAVGGVLVSMGLVRDAILASGLAVVNGLIGVVQEVIAKRRLDKIALLNRAKATVVRDGGRRQVGPEEIVQGDLLAVGPGDQIFVDGRVVEGALQVDESLLTGEADAVPKEVGDEVSSGSFCVSGGGLYEAERVGSASTAAVIAAGAKAHKMSLTPLQREVNQVVRMLLVVAGFFLAMLLIGSVLHGYPVRETVLAAAVVLGIVPSGLFLMIVVTYSMAIVRLARQDALIQQVNAVESLSNVDVFCMDKTGTLTANKIALCDLRPIAGDEASIKAALAAFARSASGGTKTSEAVAAAYPGEARPILAEVPFSSARKWSAVAADADGFRGTFALGAPEFLGRLVRGGETLKAPAGWADKGWRILLFAASPEVGTLTGPDGEPALPETTAPVAWLAFADELRPNSKATLDGFRDAGIALKIISGDNPETVAALARQAGLPQDAVLVSGLELAEMDDAAFAEAAAGATVFGRVTPEQKQKLVQALKAEGHYVAMTGDGVNDVLSLKEANLGIAMQSGSQATRNAADIVLLNDSFAALPAAFKEGQRIRRGLQGILQLFLARVFTVALIILAVLLVEAGFPFSPAHLSLLTLLTVGIPTFGLALWARPGPVPASLGKELLRFVLPAATLLAATAFLVYTVVFVVNRLGVEDFIVVDGVIAIELGSLQDAPVIGTADAGPAAPDEIAREALIHTLVLGGLILVVFAAPPTSAWAAVERPTGDWRPALLALAMLPIYVAILTVPPLREFFQLETLELEDYFVIGGLVALWALLLRRVWRNNSFGRFFGYDAAPTPSVRKAVA